MNYDLFIEEVKQFEGFRSKPYLCPSGVLTIGYGHTHGVTKNMVVDEFTASCFLSYDLLLAYSQLCSVHVNVIRPCSGLGLALTDFVLNIGISKYKNSTLKKVVDEVRDPNFLTDNEKQRISLQLMKWCYSKSKKLKGLEKRRSWEVSLIFE